MATKSQRMAANTDRQKAELVYFDLPSLLEKVHIDPSRNIRTDYDVETLAAVIKRDGEIFEPIEIRLSDKTDKTKKPYTLGSDGHRRYYAAQWLLDHGHAKQILDVPCKVIAHRPSTIEATLRQLSTGLGQSKKTLDPLEEARGYLILLSEGYAKNDKELAKKRKVTPQHVYARLCLLNTKILHPLIKPVGLNICETLARVFVTENERPWLKVLVKKLATIDKDGTVTVHKDGLALATDICNRHGIPARDVAMAKLKGADETDNLREIWPNEALDFTPWLADHLSELGKALRLELELEERESSVGGFALDILARDLGSDSLVVIENQLESTNHDHLGKLLTYAAAYDAKVMVWIAKKFNSTHRDALNFLNRCTGKDRQFFGVKVDLREIKDSRPTVEFTPVATPKEWREQTKSNTRGVGRSKKEVGLPTVKARLRPSKRPVKGTEHT